MRKRRRWTLWAGAAGAIAIIVVGSAVGATRATDQRAQNLRDIIGTEPPSLDPGLATDTTSGNIIRNLFEPLIRFGPKSEALPAAAQSWSVKGTTVTLNLRKDMKWTNGQAVTAQDFVYAWLRTISPELGSDYAYQFFGIKGAEAYNSCDPKKDNCNAVRSQVGLSAPGKFTMRVQLKSPQAWFIQQLSHQSFSAVHKATVDKFGDKWTEPGNIVSYGPFKLTSWQHDASLTLTKDPKWRDAKSVKLNKVTLTIITDATTAENAYAAGNADAWHDGSLAPVSVPKWKKTPDYKTYGTIGTYYYGFNVKNIPDVNQRRAMALAIDRKAIIKYVTQGGQFPAKGFTPRRAPGAKVILANASMPAVSKLAQAKALMAKVKNPKTNINLYFNTSTTHAAIATAVQAFWKELGISTTLKNMEFGQYLEFLGPPPNSAVDVYRLGWIYDYPDAYNGLELWKCDSGNNNTGWCNKAYDAIVEKAAATQDDAARTKLYQQAETILTGANGQLPIMPIYWYVYHALVKPYVQGYNVDLTDGTDYTKVSLR